jgi:hypothetical protein
MPGPYPGGPDEVAALLDADALARRALSMGW